MRQAVEEEIAFRVKQKKFYSTEKLDRKQA